MYMDKLKNNRFTIKDLLTFLAIDRDGHIEYTLNNMYITLNEDELYQLKNDLYKIIQDLNIK